MSTAGAPFALSQLGQVALTVNDLDRAVAFYRDCLGLRFLFRAPNVAFFDCGGVRLMLGQSEQPDARPHGTVLYYRVADLRPAFETLKQRGAAVEREPHLVARMPDHDLWMAFFRDPDGNLFGLMSEVRHS